MMPPIVAKILMVAGIILALPLIFAWSIFVLGLVFARDDGEGHAERGGNVIVRTIEHSLPAWTDPFGWFLAVGLAAILVLGWIIYQRRQ